ncbi:MAG: prenyltransferase/squalene oxidase repeat-containing protein [Candidatus Hodarchaeota archaeon]
MLFNTPWITYIKEDQVVEIKANMVNFSNSHQNPTTGLFIEVDIDSNYHAINSINFTISREISKLIDPNNNLYLEPDLAEFFFHYLFEKQNEDGSFSDVAGVGNIFSSYQVIQTINQLDDEFIDPEKYRYKIDGMIQFLWDCYGEYGWGFKLKPEINESDIVSTYCTSYLANRLSASYVLYNENLTNFVNSLWLGGFLYSPTATYEDARSTYYGIKAVKELEDIQKDLGRLLYLETPVFWIYLASLYNSDDGGYKDTQFGESDVESTYYVLSSLKTLGLPYTNEKETYEYIINCSNPDGGFGLRPGENYTSDFRSGWAAINSLNLLKSYGSLNDLDLNNYITRFYNWSYQHQASNGLFGQITLETNYFGVLSEYNLDPDGFVDRVKIQNITYFVNSCYNPDDGGFGSQPDSNSSTYSTFCAVNLYQIFIPYTNTWLPNETATELFLVDLQNIDGGFRIGNDLDIVASQFEPMYQYYKEILNPNTSTVENTYWAIHSLNILDAIELINNSALFHWIRSSQNADGGFSVFIGFYSDVVSTYYGLELLKTLNIKPMSLISAIEFLKGSQLDDGSFVLLPALSGFGGFGVFPSSFLICYFASMALYDYNYQSENIVAFLSWYKGCISSTTHGMGDLPGFGGDLRNTPYSILLIEDLQFDQGFDPTSWTEMMFIIFLLELIALAFYGMYAFIHNFNLPVKLRQKFGLGKKFAISYLERFPAIRCDNLSIFAGRKLIVDSMTMSLDHGEILGVLGESGAGKSTFVKGLLGMRRFKGISEVYGMNVKKKAKKMRPIYGYVPQDLSKIYSDFTVLENLIYFGGQYGLAESEIKRKARRILRALEIEDKMHELVKSLSGGQKRRVSIAIGLIHNPIIVWMDEPTSGLDPVVRENLWLTLTRINEQFNTTLIVVTHYPEESRFCNKVVIFGRNRGMIDFGRPKDLISQLPGEGRTVELALKEVTKKALERLKSIDGFETVLENKVGTDYSIFTNLDLGAVIQKIETEIGKNSIQSIKQGDAKMEMYFRYKSMEVPKIEEI